MQLGVTDHIWTIGELIDAALEGVCCRHRADGATGDLP
jgi:hypothetical protein